MRWNQAEPGESPAPSCFWDPEGDRAWVPSRILFYDGSCEWCCAWVAWLGRRAGPEALQCLDQHAEEAVGLLTQLGAAHELLQHVFLLEDGQLHRASTAVVRAVSGLGGGWRLVRVLLWIPERWRDAGYRWVARNRHRLPKRVLGITSG